MNTGKILTLLFWELFLSFNLTPLFRKSYQGSGEIHDCKSQVACKYSNFVLKGLALTQPQKTIKLNDEFLRFP